MDIRAIIAKVLVSSVGKTAVVSVAGVTAGAVVATGATSVAYKNEIKHYKNVIASGAIDEYKEAKESKDGNTQSENGLSLNALEGQTLRVFDGMVQIYTEDGWTDYATVDDIEKQDPFYGTDEKRAAVELEVLNEKLEEAGIVLNEEGQLVKAEELLDSTETKGTLFTAGSILVEKSAGTAVGANTKSSATSNSKSGVAGAMMDQATLMALAQAAPTDPNAAAQLQKAVESGTVIAAPSGGGGGTGSSGGGSSWSSGSSDSGSSGGSSWSGGSSGGGSTPSYSEPSYSEPSGGGSSDSGSSDSGSSDSGSSDSGSSDSGSDSSSDSGSSDGDGEDFGGDVL